MGKTKWYNTTDYNPLDCFQSYYEGYWNIVEFEDECTTDPILYDSFDLEDYYYFEDDLKDEDE